MVYMGKPPPEIEEPDTHQYDQNYSSWWLNHPFEKYARQFGNLPQVSG